MPLLPVPTLNVNNFRRYKGDSSALPIELQDPNTGDPFNPTDWVLVFTVKRRANVPDQEALIQKISTVEGITVTNAAQGKITVQLLVPDFEHIYPERMYVFDVRAQNIADPELVYTVAIGTIWFAATPTHEATLSVPTYTVSPAALINALNALLDDALEDLEPYIDEQIATKADVDQMNLSRTLRHRNVDTIAQLQALVPVTSFVDGEIVTVAGHTIKGLGGGDFYYDAASTSTVDNVTVYSVFGGVGRWHRIYDGDIEPEWAGAGSSSDDTNALLAAIAAANSTERGSVKLRGVTYLTSATLTLANRISFSGVNQSAKFVPSDVKNCTRILCSTDNIPIVNITGSTVLFKGIALEFAIYQDSTKTNAQCLRLSGNSYFCNISDISFCYGAYAIYQPDGAASFNNVIYRPYVRGYSISAFRLNGGTSNTVIAPYVQNLIGPALTRGTVTNIVKTGVQLEITVDAMPTHLLVNRYFLLQEITQSQFNGYYVAKAITGNVITVDMSTDPGFDPILKPGSFASIPAQAATGPIVEIADGHYVFVGADFEHVVTTSAYAINCRATNCIFVDLHLEAVYVANAGVLIRGGRGNLRIESMTMYNFGVVPGQSLQVLTNNGGAMSVGQIYARDIAHAGATLNLATSTTTPPTLQKYYESPSARANSDGNPNNKTGVGLFDAYNGFSAERSDAGTFLNFVRTAVASWTANFNGGILNFVLTQGFLKVTNLVTDLTNKVGGLVLQHYNNSEEPFALITGASQSGQNIVSIGGGGSSVNAASRINFYHAPGGVTTTGTRVFGCSDDSGRFDLQVCPTFADNAAAISGGLSPGQFYRTSAGVLMIRY